MTGFKTLSAFLKQQNQMNTDKSNARLTGIFFIAAAITSIIGLSLYNPVLQNVDFLILGASHKNQIVLGAIMELFLAVSAIGTAIMLYPYLRKYNESLGLGYVCFRMLEVVFILIGTVSVLAMVSLSEQYTYSILSDNSYYNILGLVLKGIHDWTFMLGPNFMLGVNTFIYSYVFYQTNLVPKPLSVLGIVGAVFIFAASILEIFGLIVQISASGVVLALPIFTFEMSLAVWLIVKGFNLQYLKNKKDGI